MSLAALLASYDEAALTAAASKGLVIRAGKDVEAGKVAVSAQDANSATLDVLGETVQLVGKTLEAGRCTCPATGVCRHMLAAVLFLREGGTEAPVLPERVQFTLDEIEKFAGTDWGLACAMAQTAVVPEMTGSVVVTFGESDAQVTFPAGLGLRQALYKGSVAAHKRRAIAAAALAMAHAGGAVLPEVISAKAGPGADMDTLDRAAKALETAAIALAAGTFSQVQVQLYNLAISTRAEAIPRLAAELRGLSQQMTPEAIRTAHVTPIDLLGRIARTYALVAAMRAAPADPALVGVIARSFVASGPRTLAFLGGETWVTPSGAKGLTLVFVDLATGTIHRATEARGANADFRFDPRAVWGTTFWALARPAAMVGRKIHLADAALAGDGGLGLTQTGTFAGSMGFDDLPDVFDRWSDAQRAVNAQKGLGLRRQPGDAYVVCRPSDCGAVSFDAYAQAAVWDWIDASGQSLTLKLPQVNEQHLAALVRRIRGGLVALPPGGGAGRLVSLWLEGPEPGPISLGLEQLPQPKGLGAMVDRFMERVQLRDDSMIAPLDPLALYFERATEAVIAGLIARPGLPDRLVSDAQALGLGQVIAANDAWRAGGLPDALRLAYVLAAGRDVLR